MEFFPPIPVVEKIEKTVTVRVIDRSRARMIIHRTMYRMEVGGPMFVVECPSVKSVEQLDKPQRAL